MNLQEWLEQKFSEWERTQDVRQSYYNFARYLDVNHTDLAQWLNGVSRPAGEDLSKLAEKLGSEIYAILGIRSEASIQAVADAHRFLPAALRARLDSAVTEAGAAVSQRRLDPESDEAKRLVLKIFEKWGFLITG